MMKGGMVFQNQNMMTAIFVMNKESK